MNVVNSYIEFLKQFENGVKRVYVTEEFYTWMEENLGLLYASTPEGRKSYYSGVEICKEIKD